MKNSRREEHAGPRFRYLSETDKKAYLREIGRLLELDPEPAMHAALFFSLRFLKLAKSKGKEPHDLLRGFFQESEAPKEALAAPEKELSETLKSITTRLLALEKKSQDAPGLTPLGQTVTPVTMVAAAPVELPPLVVKAEPKEPEARTDYRACRRMHRTLQF